MMRRVGRRRRVSRVLLVPTLVSLAVPVVGHSHHAAAASPIATSRFVPIAPVRLADTRADGCGCTAMDATTIRVDVAGHPAVPDDAVAAALTITSAASTGAGFVTAYPAGSALPETSTLNTRPGRDVANSAITPLHDCLLYTSPSP